MQQLYKDYHIFFTVIAVVAFVAIIKNTINNIKQLGVNEERVHVIMDRIQKAAILRTVKICKTAMKMQNMKRTFRKTHYRVTIDR